MIFRKLILCFCVTTVTNFALYSAEPTPQDKKTPVLSALKITGIGVLIVATTFTWVVLDEYARKERCNNGDNYSCTDQYKYDLHQNKFCLFDVGVSVTALGAGLLAWEGLKAGSSYSWKACKSVGKLASNTLITKKP